MEEVHKKREQDRQSDMTVRISRLEAEDKKDEPVAPGMIGGKSFRNQSYKICAHLLK